MRDVSGQLVRMWAAILVAYALLLGTLAPAFAAPPPLPTAAGVICGTLAPGSAETPAPGGADHGKVCCILCTVAGPPLLPVPVAEPARRPAEAVAAEAPPLRALTPDGPPAAAPRNPRAPPAVA